MSRSGEIHLSAVNADQISRVMQGGQIVLEVMFETFVGTFDETSPGRDGTTLLIEIPV